MTHVWNAAEKRRRLYNKQAGRCAICGEGMKLRADGMEAVTLDHKVPRSIGGGGHISNLRAVHRRCNELRGNGMEVVI